MDTKQSVLEIVAEVSGREASQITPEMELVADLAIDSPKALQLILDLEDKLGVEISDEDAAKMDSVGDILDFFAAQA